MLDYWGGGRKNGSDIMILCGATPGNEMKRSPWRPGGRCSFLDENDLCVLHEKGLKPVEGRVADCKSEEDSFPVHKKIAFTWDNKKARKIIEKWKTEYMP